MKRKRPDLRFGRLHSRCRAGVRTAKMRRSRRNMEKLRTMRLHVKRAKQVQCGKTGHDPVHAWRECDVMCGECEKDISHLYSSTCTWKQHDDVHMPGTWEGTCGAMWTLTKGSPSENEMKFCPRCGLYLVEDCSSA